MTGLRPGRLRELKARSEMNAGTLRSSNQAQHPGKQFAYVRCGLTPPHFHFHEKLRLIYRWNGTHFWQVSNSSCPDGFILKINPIKYINFTYTWLWRALACLKLRIRILEETDFLEWKNQQTKKTIWQFNVYLFQEIAKNVCRWLPW
jgi:hypothetical protein